MYIHCELVAIALALEKAVEIVKGGHDAHFQNVYIGSDCKSAIEIAALQKSFQRRMVSLERINIALAFLHQCTVVTRIFWCPGHVDYKFNEIADQAAKNISEKIKSGEIDAPDIFSEEAAMKCVV